MDVVASFGHTQMTPVQAATIPLFMKHKDVVVEVRMQCANVSRDLICVQGGHRLWKDTRIRDPNTREIISTRRAVAEGRNWSSDNISYTVRGLLADIICD
jgi:hypothetical protein